MKIRISKLPFITFLKTIKYICYTVFVTWHPIYLKISMEPSRGYCKTCYVDPIVEISIQQQNIRTQTHLLVRTLFNLYKKSQSLGLQTNEILLYLQNFIPSKTLVDMATKWNFSSILFFNNLLLNHWSDFEIISQECYFVDSF